jgi:hypothetical protein
MMIDGRRFCGSGWMALGIGLGIAGFQFTDYDTIGRFSGGETSLADLV